MPTKILYLNHVSKMGGAEENLFSLIKSLDKKKYTPILICQEDGELPQKLRKIGVEVKYLKMRGWRKAKYFLANFITVIKLLIFIKRNNIRLVHVNPYRLAPYGALAARWAKIPSVLSIHDFVDESKIKRFLIDRTNKIIVVSDSIKKVFSSRNDKVRIIHNGVDFSIFDKMIKGESIKKEFAVANGTYLVGIVGQITPWKGHQDFLAAAVEVLKKKPFVKFLIVGDALFNKELSIEKLREISRQYKINSQVIFTGLRKDIPQLIAALDILVLPSRQEPFGRVILEAMAMGKPVIATDCGGPAEIITSGQTGMLIPVKRPDLLAEAIIRLLSNRLERERLSQAGYQLVKNKFDLQKQVNKVTDLYEQVL